MAQRGPIQTPLGGQVTAVPALDQPPGTFRRGKNVRPHDVRADFLTRFSRRAGTSKFYDDELGDGNPIRAGACGKTFGQLGAYTSGTVLMSDGFAITGGDLAYGTLGDRRNNTTGAASSDGTQDYKVYTGGFRLGAAPFFGFNAVYAAGRGPFVDDSSNAVMDTKSGDSGDHTASPIDLFGCIYLPTIPNFDANSFSISIKFKTAADLTGKMGVIGLMCFADETDPGGEEAGNNSVAAIIRENTGSSAIQAIGWIQDNAHASAAVSIINDQANVASLSWAAATTYVLKLVVSKNYGELQIDVGATGTFQAVATWPNMRADATATPVEFAITGNKVGFVLANVGDSTAHASGSEFFDWVDDFEVSSLTGDRFDEASRLVAVADTNVYLGDSSEIDLAALGTGVIVDTPDCCVFAGPGPAVSGGSGPYIYILDGAAYNRVSLSANAVSTWAATSGTLPQGVSDNGLKARYGVLWEAFLRVALWGLKEYPDNLYLSASEDPDDWNIISADPYSRSYALPFPFFISCVHPFTRNGLIVASYDTMKILVGDPGLGGYRDDVTEKNGVCGPFAFTRGSNGEGYFVSPHNGFNILSPDGGQPESLSDSRERAWFRSIDYHNNVVRTAYSRRHDGVHVLVYPRDDSETIKTMFWHRPTNAFFPDEFPVEQGPSTLISYTDLRLTDKELILLGGKDGYLRKFDADADDDDGEVIDAYADMVLTNGGENNLRVNQIMCASGSTNESAEVRLYSAEIADKLLDATRARETSSWRGAVLSPATTVNVGDPAILVRVGSHAEGPHRGEYFSIDRITATLADGQRGTGRGT